MLVISDKFKKIIEKLAFKSYILILLSIILFLNLLCYKHIKGRCN